MSEPEAFQFEESVEMLCPCGKLVRIGRATGSAIPSMDDGGTTPTALHAVPHCKDFERLDLLSYMRWLRRATEN